MPLRETKKVRISTCFEQHIWIASSPFSVVSMGKYCLGRDLIMTCNSMTKQMLLVLPLLLLTAFASGAVELVSAQARALSSVSSVGGYSIIPAGTEPASYGDLAPVQLFEIVKPDGQSVTIRDRKSVV